MFTPEERIERLMTPVDFQELADGSWVARRHDLVGVGADQAEAVHDLNEKEYRHTHEPLPEHLEQLLWETREEIKESIRKKFRAKD